MIGWQRVLLAIAAGLALGILLTGRVWASASATGIVLALPWTEGRELDLNSWADAGTVHLTAWLQDGASNTRLLLISCPSVALGVFGGLVLLGLGVVVVRWRHERQPRQ